jgi:hypothetical protein
MSHRITLATFEHEHDVLSASAELRRRGFPVLDVYSPHSIHGMDAALGLRPSRLTWVCFVCGAIGGLGMLWFQHWVNAVQWPINVGGKPWNSLPAEAPVAFEMLVLLAAFGSVLACLLACRLFPGRRPHDLYEGVTDDVYVIALGEAAHLGGPSELQSVLRQYDVLEISERIQS